MKKFRLVFVAVILIAGVALGVHLMHKDALALNTNFTAQVDWGGFNPNDANIQVHLITRGSFAGPALDNVVMDFQNNDGQDISHYTASFIPNSASVVWEIQITDNIIFPHHWTINPVWDDDDIVWQGNNDMDTIPEYAQP
jgi:hypothetical protein